MALNLYVCFTEPAFWWVPQGFFWLSWCWTNTMYYLVTVQAGLVIWPSHRMASWWRLRDLTHHRLFFRETIILFLVTEWQRHVPGRVCQTTRVTWRASSVCAKNSKGWHPGIREQHEALLTPWRQRAGTLGARYGQVRPRNRPHRNWDKGPLTR